MSKRHTVHPEAPGVSAPPARLRGLDRPFPTQLFVLHNARDVKYIVIDAFHPTSDIPEAFEEGFEGLACFSTIAAAQSAAARLGVDGLNGFEPMEITFEDARLLAWEKTSDIGCLMLMDRSERPLLHFVR